jgi:hypothetical protein
MFSQFMLLLYRLFLDEGGQRVRWIERYLGFGGGVPVSLDERRNEQSAYATVFSEECQKELDHLYLNLMNDMKGVPYKQCGDVLEALEFLQAISAIALWKYHQVLGERLDAFVRDFDRLDVPSERLRIYENAQVP